jgi:hypothetical protein
MSTIYYLESKECCIWQQSISGDTACSGCKFTFIWVGVCDIHICCYCWPCWCCCHFYHMSFLTNLLLYIFAVYFCLAIEQIGTAVMLQTCILETVVCILARLLAVLVLMVCFSLCRKIPVWCIDIYQYHCFQNRYHVIVQDCFSISPVTV